MDSTGPAAVRQGEKASEGWGYFARDRHQDAPGDFKEVILVRHVSGRYPNTA